MKTALFFGSFNPIHIGHMAIANYVVEFTDVDQLWFVISPQNPLKKKSTLLPDYHRLELVNIAIGDDPRFRACDIEFKLPKPSYTIDTLTYLREKYPKKEFVIVMGADGLANFSKWKNYQQIISTTTRYVYPRPGADSNNLQHPENIVRIKAPLMDISSTFIRDAISKGRKVDHFLPFKVQEYIEKMNFYK